MATGAYPLYSPDLGAPSRYLQHVSKKNLGASEVKTFVKNEAKSFGEHGQTSKFLHDFIFGLLSVRVLFFVAAVILRITIFSVEVVSCCGFVDFLKLCFLFHPHS